LEEIFNVWEVSKYRDFFVKGQSSKWPIAKIKIKMSFETHPQLIIMDLQEGMVIKGI
jgi:hypothetical protein